MMEWVACVGIDWADQKHDYAVRGRDGSEEQGTFSSSPEEVHGWVERLRARYPDGTIVVSMEQSRGPLLYALSIYDFLALVPINPRAASAYRDSLHLSGAKDDPVDAGLIRDFAAAHLDKLRVWRAEDTATRKLRLLVEHRREMVEQRTSLTQTLLATIKQYFPQALTWFGGHKTLLRAILTEWPALESIQQAHASEIQKVIRSCTRMSAAKIAQISAAICSARPLTTDVAITSAMVIRVQSLIAVLEVVDEQVEAHERAIAELWADHDDRALFESFPGAGPVLAPRLAAAFGSDRSRFAEAVEMQNYSGTSPVTVKSGKHRTVHARWQKPKFLHQTFHEFAEASIPHCPWARAYYRQQRERGASRRVAIRALAFRWIRVLHACWATSTAYDEAKYLAALARRGSALCDRLAA
jgi:transposase